MKKLLFVFLLLLSPLVGAVTPEQNAALKAAVLAETTIAACVAGGNDVCVSNWLNSSSTFIVWRTQVTQESYQSESSLLATQFDWSGAGGYISRSQGERDAWRAMFASGSVNPSRSNIRAAFSDIFSGTGAGAVNNRSHLLSLSKRTATIAEKTLAIGTGSDVSPGSLTFEGQVGVNDISSILGR